MDQNRTNNPIAVSLKCGCLLLKQSSSVLNIADEINLV